MVDMPGDGDILGDILVRIRSDTRLLEDALRSGDRMASQSAKKMNQNVASVAQSYRSLSYNVTSFNRSFAEGFRESGKHVDMLGRKVGSLAGVIANPYVVGTIAVVGFGIALKNAIQTTARFEKEFANVTTLFDTSVYDVKALELGLRLMNTEFGKSADLAKAAYQAISAGIDPEKTLKALKDASIFATAALVDQFTAIDIGTTVINAYGLQVSELNTVYDQLFKTIELGKTTGEELSQSLGMAIPFAAELEVSLAELTAAVGAMTKGGIKTDIAVTALRQTLATFLQPTSEAKKLAQQLGVELSATTIRSKGLLGALKELADAAKGNSEATATFFGNIRALTAVLSLTGKQAAEFERMLGLIENSMGATRVAFEKQTATLSEQWERLGVLKERYQLFFGMEVGGPLMRGLREFNDILEITYTSLMVLTHKELRQGLFDLMRGITESEAAKNLIQIVDLTDIWAKGMSAQFPEMRSKIMELAASLDGVTKETADVRTASALAAEQISDGYSKAGVQVDELEKLLTNLGDEQLKILDNMRGETEKINIRLVSKDQVDAELALLDYEYNKALQTYGGLVQVAEYYDAKKKQILQGFKQEQEKIYEDLLESNIKAAYDEYTAREILLRMEVEKKRELLKGDAEAIIELEKHLTNELNKIHKDRLEKESAEEEKALRESIKRRAEYVEERSRLMEQLSLRTIELTQGRFEAEKFNLQLQKMEYEEAFGEQAWITEWFNAEYKDLMKERAEIDREYFLQHSEQFHAWQELLGQFGIGIDPDTLRAQYEPLVDIFRMTGDIMQSVSSGVSQSIQMLITGAGTVAEVWQSVATTVLATIIDMLVQMALKQILLWLFSTQSAAAYSVARMSELAAETYAAAFAATAAIPIIGPEIAPAVAAAAVATMLAGAAESAAIGAAAGTGITGAAQGAGAAAGANVSAPFTIPAFATGGFVDTPTLAIVGDVPEWIIPEDKIVEIGAGGFGTGVTIGQVVIKNYGNLVRPVDIDMLADKAVVRIASGLQNRLKRGR